MGYSRWQTMSVPLNRAMAAARNQGLDVEREFSQVSQVTRSGNLGDQGREDYELSRMAAYLLAMNGDPNKPEIAAAQTYFAVRTREAETRPAPREMTKLEALRAAIESEEGRLVAEARAEIAEQHAAELAPSAKAWDTLADVKGDYSLRDAAHILNRDPNISTGQQRLLKTLRSLGMIDQRGIPYAKHAAHLVERPRTYKHPQTGEPVLAKPQIRVTVKGLRYLHGKLDGVAPLRFEQIALRDAE
jgi:DNA-damage-inducible protein D